MTNPTPTRRLAIAGKRVALLLVACFLPVACHKKEATNEMQALVEARWPGKFALHRTRLLADLQGYEVIFVARDDANFRLHLDHRELTRCQPQHCAEMLQGAYEGGAYRAARLNASIAAFKQCGVPMLGVGESAVSDVMPVVALDIQGDTTAALERLAPCIQSYWRNMSTSTYPAEVRPGLELELRQRKAEQVNVPEKITWGSDVPDHESEPLYTMWLAPDTPLPPKATYLRMDMHSAYYRAQEAQILANASAYLKKNRPAAGLLPTLPRVHAMRPDAQDITRMYAHLLFCSNAASRRPPAAPNSVVVNDCFEDQALLLHHDSRSGKTQVLQVLENIRADRGIVTLPPLPGDKSPVRPYRVGSSSSTPAEE